MFVTIHHAAGVPRRLHQSLANDFDGRQIESGFFIRRLRPADQTVKRQDCDQKNPKLLLCCTPLRQLL